MEKYKIYRTSKKNLKLRKILYYIMGTFEVLFAIRLIFKFLGANPGSNFISLIYTITGVFLAPFSGVFRTVVNNGIETKSVFEATTIIAMIVYWLVAYGAIRLVEIYGTPKYSELR